MKKLTLKELNDSTVVMELFHGPTLAFKDIAMQLIGNFYQYYLGHDQKKINIIVNKNDITQKEKKLNAILNGVNYTRDLVSEPGNILHPDEYAKRLLKLKKT